jgi:hypothetical protein
MVWPELTTMAFDLMAVPTISSECERVFLSCAKITTADSGRLQGNSLASTVFKELGKQRGYRACVIQERSEG